MLSKVPMLKCNDSEENIETSQERSADIVIDIKSMIYPIKPTSIEKQDNTPMPIILLYSLSPTKS